jgi:hypothetical protein
MILAAMLGSSADWIGAKLAANVHRISCRYCALKRRDVRKQGRESPLVNCQPPSWSSAVPGATLTHHMIPMDTVVTGRRAHYLVYLSNAAYDKT